MLNSLVNEFVSIVKTITNTESCNGFVDTKKAYVVFETSLDTEFVIRFNEKKQQVTVLVKSENKNIIEMRSSFTYREEMFELLASNYVSESEM